MNHLLFANVQIDLMTALGKTGTMLLNTLQLGYLIAEAQPQINLNYLN